MSQTSSPRTAFTFPPNQPEQFPAFDEHRRPSLGSPGGPYASDGLTVSPGGEKWAQRRDVSPWGNGTLRSGGTRPARQKSLSEAIRSVRRRPGSVSHNAHEIADALKAPLSPTLVGLCAFWYMASIMSNTSSKTILTAFPKPVTLTIIQFAFVCSWCMAFDWLARAYPRLKTWVPALKNGIQYPNKEIIYTTLPLTAFQIGGHILSSEATTRIPVSLVHTIKGLSPLFTVLAYRFIFKAHYSWPTYLSLIPLTVGVAMACSVNLSGNFVGVVAALASALLFVTQNIVSKRIFNEAALAEQGGLQRTRKPDKLNLLCYSSGLAFLFTAPIWLFSEGHHIIGDLWTNASVDVSGRQDGVEEWRLLLEFIFNGTFHFMQNIVAFALLSMISPVTYSVASLIKRVFVITFAIVWFGNPMSSVQATGIGLTFFGLYLYDRSSDAAKVDRKQRAMQIQNRDVILPLTGQNGTIDSPSQLPNGHSPGEHKKTDSGPQRPWVNTGVANWLPPGTKQEETWTPQDTRHSGATVAAT